MSKGIELLPSILAANQGCLMEGIRLVESCGIRGIHIDSMDGHFVPNICIGPHCIADIRKATNLFFDVHLMLTNPQNIIEAYLDAGADRITVHVELESDKIFACEQLARKRGIEFGLAINFGTMAKAVYPYLDIVDSVLVMSVKAGFSGQKFLQESLNTVKDLADKVDKIQIDGGITSSTANECMNCGVKSLELILGSSFFSQHNEFKLIQESLL